MTGVWLTRLGHRLLHHQTFELMVAPAIADLQFEAPSADWMAIVRGYVAVWIAFAGALVRDVDLDLHALRGEAATLTALIVLQSGYYASMLVLLSGLTTKHALEQLLVPRVRSVAFFAICALLAVSVVTTVLSFWPSRRGTSPDLVVRD